ncbi:MAG TPA: DUF1501 domain-containing protein [Pirellulaceae bacterium]|nr:DUF1501 domain-containing protein [Pirellulaceae bacterium]
MLSLHYPSSRRAFLQIGSLALGGLTLPQLLAARTHAAEQKRPVKDKSVIFLFLHGGPSQFETFDPKMDAPAEIRSTTGEIPTKLPGITFGSTFGRLAALNDKFSIVRSFRTGDGNHDIKPVVGKATLGANLGSLYARVAGTNHPASGMPLNCALFPRAVNAEAGPMVESFGKFDSVGTLGSAYAPFIPGGGGSFQKNLELAIARDRVDDRRNLLAGLDSLKRGVDQGTIGGVDKFQQQALTTILGGVAEAFDISKEDPKTIARYDTAPLVRPDQISRTWNNYPRYVDNAKTLGKLLLLARRLCEAGCGFVTVTTNFVWDMHADVNNAGCEEGMSYMGVPLDHALSAFIEDTQARGLDEKILLVACGEMGRTPRINKNGGRDHWGGLAPLLLYGGGLKMGQVLGQSSRDGGEPQSEPVTIENLIATIADELLDLGEVRLMSSLPNELVRTLTSGSPIPGLL